MNLISSVLFYSSYDVKQPYLSVLSHNQWVVTTQSNNLSYSEDFWPFMTSLLVSKQFVCQSNAEVS